MDDKWLKIRNDYLCGVGSMRELADKYGVGLSAIKMRSAREGWRKYGGDPPRKLNQSVTNDVTKNVTKLVTQKTIEKVADKISDDETDRIMRIRSISDRLLQRLEQAEQELDKAIKVTKYKDKVTRKLLDEEGKPYYDERVVEYEDTEMVDAPVDRAGIRQLAATLKDLQAVTALGTQEETENGDARFVVEPGTEGLWSK